jgi:hypothetical protein
MIPFTISGRTDKRRLQALHDRRSRSLEFYMHGEQPFGVKRPAIMKVSSFGKAIGSRIPERHFTAGISTEASAFVLASIQHRQS